jgi:Zn-dependent peptidase ImmA (M78 family)/transcriptional regulator with XRE-family HTH domain
MTDNVISFPAATSKRRLVVSRLKDARLAVCLNQSELADAVGVTRQAISAYEQGEKSPEPETMMRIAAALKQPVSYFASEDRQVFGEYSSMFFRAVGPTTKRRNMACTVIGRWFTQVTTYIDSLVNFPPVNLPQISPASSNGRYDVEEIELAAEECRKVWNLGLGPIANVLSLLEVNGITVCRCPLEGETIEAFSFWNGNRPFVVLASEKHCATRSRFDTAHELAHLILHRWIGPEELEDPKVLKLIEREADRFASAFLLPHKTFPAEVFTTRLDSFVALKQRWKVSIQAMVYRCKQLGVFDEDQVTNLYKQISARRWRTREPLDDVLPLEQPRLLRRAVEMVVSAGRKFADEIAADLQIAKTLIAGLCNLPKDFFSPGAQQEFSPSLKA